MPSTESKLPSEIRIAKEHGALRFATARDTAKEQLIRDWSEQRAARPEKSTLLLAHTRVDVAELNQGARTVLKQRGELGPEVRVETWREVTLEDDSLAIERGERLFAPSDRVMFLKNDRVLGVKNGSLGTVTSVNRDSMRVTLDGKEPREVRFDLRDYGSIEYGYAATVTRRRAPPSTAHLCWPRPEWIGISPTSA